MEHAFYEEVYEIGDLLFYDGRTVHGVQDIDPLEPIDLTSISGRFSAVAPLFKE